MTSTITLPICFVLSDVPEQWKKTFEKLHSEFLLTYSHDLHVAEVSNECLEQFMEQARQKAAVFVIEFYQDESRERTQVIAGQVTYFFQLPFIPTEESIKDARKIFHEVTNYQTSGLPEVEQHLSDLLALSNRSWGKETFRASSSKPRGRKWKRLHLVRHGEGLHNVMGKSWPFSCRCLISDSNIKFCPYIHPYLIDPELNPVGISQAQALQSIVASLEPPPTISIVSSLRRATQTGIIACENIDIPFLAHEKCREPPGGHICDRRLQRSKLAEQFPSIDYSSIPEEDEDYICAGKKMPKHQSAKRIHEFYSWVWNDVEEDVILIFCHSDFLLQSLNIVLKCDEPELKTWFANGELRSIYLSIDFEVIFDDSEN